MFELEEKISEWRNQMLASGIKSPVPLEELEIHLREDVERQIQFGANGQRAFETAIASIGQTKLLKMEFKKIDAENWNRPLAWSAWALFVVSFFLPALGDDPGWKCAGISATAVSWPDFRYGNLGTIHLASLTLANLLMIASPFLLTRLSRTVNSLKWLRFSHLAVLVLVWSYVLLLLVFMQNRKDLKIGCYVWAVSFLLLFLSTLKSRNHKTELRKEQYV